MEEEIKYKIVPFDIAKAKAGAEVVTVGDNLKVEILKYDLKCKDFPILAIINYKDGSQTTDTYGIKGNRFIDAWNGLDLRIKEEVKQRRMTNQELSWWLRDCSEEHREYKFENHIINLAKSTFEYQEENTNEEVDEQVVIRSNGGEWVEPLIEIND